ncbi:hypothetical protein, partial [Sansalvadorimonas verongulae]|uniref:hypothetical protein n=1 Tax=Sansalvadorimonas verongulae TaxID=2172824 RepID=UPI0018AD1D42
TVISELERLEGGRLSEFERRSAQIATARDQYAKVTREKLQNAAARNKPEAQHEPGSWEWYRAEHGWALSSYPFSDDESVMTEEGLYRDWLQKYGHEQGQSGIPAGGSAILEGDWWEVGL